MLNGQILVGGKASPDNLVSAVIIPCSSRKRSVPGFCARAVSLPRSSQTELETAWLLRLDSLDRACAASDLYGGRGALLGRRSASAAAAPLYIVSAGLGLVGATEMVPTYGMTVAPRGDDSISARIDGRFDPGAWWAAVCTGPVSTTLDHLLDGSEGRLTLLALTRPYAAMLADSLARLREEVAAGLRIFGWRLQEVLTPALHGSVMGYDARLEAALPGTRNDFAQRALAHFVNVVLPIGARDREEHGRLVDGALAGLEAPRRAARPRASDAEILDWLGQPAQAGGGIGRLLRRVRDEGIACEQSRFARLHALARQEAHERGVRR